MSIDKYSLFGGEEAGEQRTSVDSYNKHGFMVNGVLIQGAVILLPETTLLWDVTKMEDINKAVHLSNEVGKAFDGTTLTFKE